MSPGDSNSQALVRGYRDWCLLNDASPARSPEVVAWESLHDLIESDPDEAAAVIRAVAELLTSDEITALCSLGADALEDLLKSDPSKFLPVFERAAEADERIAIAMSAVWMSEPWHSRLVELRIRTKQQRGEAAP